MRTVLVHENKRMDQDEQGALREAKQERIEKAANLEGKYNRRRSCGEETCFSISLLTAL